MPIVFTHETPGYYLLSQIYDTESNPNSGAIIPREGSLVLDRSDDILYTVKTVSTVTLNSELEPVGTTLIAPTGQDDTDLSLTSIIDYGNSRFFLYYDTSESPTKLNLDKKIIILGDDAESFELVKYDPNSDEFNPISMYFDGNGTYMGTKVPLEEIVGSVNAKAPTNCSTSSLLNDEEVYYMHIFDYAGVQCGSIKLYARKAIVNNIAADDEIISGFELEGTQLSGGGFYLYLDQDPNSLVIVPKLLYNTGREVNLTIDQMITHIYGLEGFTPAYPGQQIDILVKYFLENSQQAAGSFVDAVAGTRFLFKQDTITVRAQADVAYQMKILTVPRYNVATSNYTLQFFLYRIGDDMVRDITHLVSIDPVFDGQNTISEQFIEMSFNIQDVFPAALSTQIFNQTLGIRLAPYVMYERYIMRDSISSTKVYGVDSPVLSRPVIYYDNTLEQYLIPTSKFANTSLFLEAFYYNNAPLYDATWLIEPITPTHFTLRDAGNGGILLAAPVAIADYFTAVSITGSNPDMLVDINVIVEFLKEDLGVFSPIFGSPVDVIMTL